MEDNSVRQFAVLRNESLRGWTPFLISNPHLFKFEDLANCNCLVDGSNICQVLWDISQKDPLFSDESAYANVVRNFFKSLLYAGIKPYVFFSQPANEYNFFEDRCIKRHNHILERESNYQSHFTMQGRTLFVEILFDMNIKNFIYAEEEIARLAKKLDALLISRRNFFCLFDIPRGFLNLNIDSKQYEELNDGPIKLRLKVFKSSLLLEFLKVEGVLRNPEIFTQLTALMQYDCCESLQSFMENCDTLVNNQELCLNYHVKGWEAERIVVYLKILAARSPNEALSAILGFVNADLRQVVRQLFIDVKKTREDFKSVEPYLDTLSCRINGAESFQNGSITRGPPPGFENFGKPGRTLMEGIKRPRTSSGDDLQRNIPWLAHRRSVIVARSSDCSENDLSDDDDCIEDRENDLPVEKAANSMERLSNGQRQKKQKLQAGNVFAQQNGGSFKPPEETTRIPHWVLELIETECNGGHQGTKFFWMIGVIEDRTYCPAFHLQDLDRPSVSFSGLPIREVIYGILFQGKVERRFRRQFFVREFSYVGAVLVHCYVRPAWEIWTENYELIEVPTLEQMSTLGTIELKRIFSTTLTGVSDWIGKNHIRSPLCDYNLLLLKTWTRRSHGLEKIDVVALLISILCIEERYNIISDVFPWPVFLFKNPVSYLTDYLNHDDLIDVHAFGQLQSIADDMCNLNAVLNCPYGRRVDKIRRCFSEELFCRVKLYLKGYPTKYEARDFIASLFDHGSLENFSRLVDLLYDSKEAPLRIPLSLVTNPETIKDGSEFVIGFEPFDDELRRFVATSTSSEPECSRVLINVEKKGPDFEREG